MAKLVLLVEADTSLIAEQELQPADIQYIRQFVFRTRKQSNGKALDVLQRDQRRFVLAIALQILIRSVVKVLELLLEHQLLEVKNCFQARTSREVS